MIALVFNSTAVSFGAVGAPIIGGIGAVIGETVGPAFLHTVGIWSALFHFIIGSFVPLMALCLLTIFFGPSGKKGIKYGLQAAPFAIFSGFAFTAPYLLIAVFLGPEFPSLLGALIGLPIVLLAARNNFLTPKNSWDFPIKEQWEKEWKGIELKMSKDEENKNEKKKMPLWLAWSPYFLITLIIIITRIPGLGLRNILLAQTIQWNNILGAGINYSLPYLYLPGIIPLVLVALIIIFIHKMPFEKVKHAWSVTFRQMFGVAVALFFAVAMAQVMIQSGNNLKDFDGMMVIMAMAAVQITGMAWPIISPLVGALGTFVSGSNTISNVLFASFQYEVAGQLGLSKVIILALQNVGGAIGNMISVHNVVAVCATVGLIGGAEGIIIRRNFIPAVIYALAVGLLALLVV